MYIRLPWNRHPSLLIQYINQSNDLSLYINFGEKLERSLLIFRFWEIAVGM